MLVHGGRRAFASLSSFALLFTTVITGVVAPSPQTSRPHVDIEGVAVGAVTERGRTVRLPRAGQMVAFSWTDGDAHELVVRARTPDGWSDWTDLHLHDDEGPDPGSREDRGKHTWGPLWVGEGTSAVQVLTREGEVQGLEAHVLQSVEPPRSPWAVRQAGATPGKPAVIPRSGWGADERLRDQPSDCNGPSYADELRFAVVHHTVSINSYPPEHADDLIRGIYAFHTQRNRWCDIGYNFIVDRFGRVYEGRFGGIEKAVIGAHAGGFNTNSTGVALLGDHRAVSVSSAARGALRALLAWKLGHHAVDPGAKVTVTSQGSSRYPKGTRVTLHTVSGHRDCSSTACPGDAAYAMLPSLRREVQADVLGSMPYPMAGWEPEEIGPRLLALYAYGGLSPAGAQEPVETKSFWPGWRITRAVMATEDGGYVADAWGGLHPFGGAPARRTPVYTRGKDLVRALVPGPAPNSGYIVDAYGGVHPFGGATARREQGWTGWPIGKDGASLPDGTGGYVLDGWGGIHPFGTAPPMRSGGYWRGWDIARAVVVAPSGTGGYVLEGFGGVHAFGTAPRLKVHHYTRGKDIHIDLVLNETGTGGWVLDIDGNIWPLGDEKPIRRSLTWWGTGLGRELAFMGVVDTDEHSESSDEGESPLPDEAPLSPEPTR